MNFKALRFILFLRNAFKNTKLCFENFFHATQHDLQILQLKFFLFLTLDKIKVCLKRKFDFTLDLQLNKTNNTFLYSKMNQLIAKSCSEIGRVNKP